MQKERMLSLAVLLFRTIIDPLHCESPSSRWPSEGVLKQTTAITSSTITASTGHRGYHLREAMLLLNSPNKSTSPVACARRELPCVLVSRNLRLSTCQREAFTHLWHRPYPPSDRSGVCGFRFDRVRGWHAFPRPPGIDAVNIFKLFMQAAQKRRASLEFCGSCRARHLAALSVSYPNLFACANTGLASGRRTLRWVLSQD
ncbi:hypothetical protein PYCCODRAFT_999901 [Trametes coccinea BRFM310]|uniref:Secreted protein n=1 Tax=Trametes coccinea (strain BRFM310) TaxID=1353009 RepID=A0A1Y2ICL3_TRAC3|nr:hypothetical protein PYCCODRAFT_999901 [Trametes coccinea BRFM310]